MPATPSLTDRTPISYGRSDDFERDFRAAIAELIDAGARRICDVGGGAKPFVGLPKIQEREEKDRIGQRRLWTTAKCKAASPNLLDES